MRFTFLLAFATLLTGCPPQPPPATINDVNQLQIRLETLNKRTAALEQAVPQWSRAIDDAEKASRQTRADQSVLIEDLRTELKSLKGGLDVLGYDVKRTDESQKKFREDLDVRVGDLEAKVAAAAFAPAPPPAPETPPTGASAPLRDGDEVTQYNRILRAYLDKKDQDTAIAQFGAFIAQHPKSRYASNSQYWISEAWMKKGEYARAVTEYQKLVDNYAKSEKLCDAIFKQGLAFAELKDPGKAKLFFSEVKSRCPKTAAAARAQKKLTELQSGTSKP